MKKKIKKYRQSLRCNIISYIENQRYVLLPTLVNEKRMRRYIYKIVNKRIKIKRVTHLCIAVKTVRF